MARQHRSDRQWESKSVGVRLTLLALLAGLTMPALGQITFPTALPITKDEGVLRVQARFARFTGDPTDMGREVAVEAYPVMAAYGITERITVFGVLPVAEKRLTGRGPNGEFARTATGVGDLSVLTRYTAYQRDARGRTFRFGPFVAFKLPTGESHQADRLGPLPRPLQIGSGSWDLSLGMVGTWQELKWEADAAITYRRNGESDGVALGNEFRLDAAYKRRLWPNNWSSGVPGFFYAALETNLINRGKNRTDGTPDPNIGGTTWYLVPGVQYVTRRHVVETALQVPILQHLNGTALENDLIAILSVRTNF